MLMGEVIAARGEITGTVLTLRFSAPASRLAMAALASPASLLATAASARTAAWTGAASGTTALGAGGSKGELKLAGRSENGEWRVRPVLAVFAVLLAGAPARSTAVAEGPPVTWAGTEVVGVVAWDLVSLVPLAASG